MEYCPAWPEFLYHYTNKEGADGIFDSGYIFKSNSAIHGEGVYLTDLPPRLGKEAILLNNYGRTTTGQGQEKDRADWCFKFRTFELFGACFKEIKGRIIWKYQDNIPIYNHWFASGKTEEQESSYKVHEVCRQEKPSWHCDEEPFNSDLWCDFGAPFRQHYQNQSNQPLPKFSNPPISHHSGPIYCNPPSGHPVPFQNASSCYPRFSEHVRSHSLPTVESYDQRENDQHPNYNMHYRHDEMYQSPSYSNQGLPPWTVNENLINSIDFYHGQVPFPFERQQPYQRYPDDLPQYNPRRFCKDDVGFDNIPPWKQRRHLPYRRSNDHPPPLNNYPIHDNFSHLQNHSIREPCSRFDWPIRRPDENERNGQSTLRTNQRRGHFRNLVWIRGVDNKTS